MKAMREKARKKDASRALAIIRLFRFPGFLMISRVPIMMESRFNTI
jgi:hypothetical protein